MRARATLLAAAGLLAAAPAFAQTDCGTAVENQRVILENRRNADQIDADAYQAARTRIEESAASCRAGQYVPAPPLPPPVTTPAPIAKQPPTLLPSQTTPQGLQIPSPAR
jgi:hypothetical protein